MLRYDNDTSFLGLFGFALSFFIICIHLATLNSFGIPHMVPLVTLGLGAWGHTLLRSNSKEMPIDETYKPQYPL
ncbi:spore germination protein [Desulfosporosinus shakirovi]|uniref:spore germination protein n=1 Tax=Desulfosporosinus shakirovi TaxID=2885154 RepID=UPI001E288F7B|nr:spore germination protein [Desulfosporosinus sp. SRJS8]MCB8818148.1 spore germination protein [Desulfosporosinus sp. SRJS8]